MIPTLLLAATLTSSSSTITVDRMVDWHEAFAKERDAAAMWRRAAMTRGIRLHELYGDLRTANQQLEELKGAAKTSPPPISIHTTPAWVPWVVGAAGVILGAVVGSIGTLAFHH